MIWFHLLTWIMEIDSTKESRSALPVSLLSLSLYPTPHAFYIPIPSIIFSMLNKNPKQKQKVGTPHIRTFQPRHKVRSVHYEEQEKKHWVPLRLGKRTNHWKCQGAVCEGEGLESHPMEMPTRVLVHPGPVSTAMCSDSCMVRASFKSNSCL